MFNEFPSLHPLIVHFPIVLILLAAGFEMVVVWKPHLWQIRWTTLFIMTAAFFSALAASTIFHAMPSADAPKAAMEIFEEHEKYAQLTLWMSGITLLLKSIGIFFKINRRLYEVIVLIAAVIAAIFLSIAGHHGARLTHVAGVGPMGRYLMKVHGEDGNMDDMKNMDMKNDTAMKMTDTMQGMENMKADSSMNMKDMNMPDMDKNTGMNNMKDMKNMKGMDKMKDMKKMPGMDNMKDMEGMEMDSSMNMKDMNNMPGMDKMKMDSSMNMKDMKQMNMPGMDTMKMPVKNPMDTLRFPDNNPVRKKNYKQPKQ